MSIRKTGMKVGTPFVVALTLTLSACAGGGGDATESAGGSTTAAPAATSVDACSLLTRDEAAAVLGGPVGDPQPGTVGSAEQTSATCLFSLASDPLEAFSVTVLHGQDQVDLYNHMRRNMGRPDGFDREIPGMGESAACTAAVLGSATLEVLDGHQVLQLTGQACDELTPAARAAIGRL